MNGEFPLAITGCITGICECIAGCCCCGCVGFSFPIIHDQNDVYSLKDEKEEGVSEGSEMTPRYISEPFSRYLSYDT